MYKETIKKELAESIQVKTKIALATNSSTLRKCRNM